MRWMKAWARTLAPMALAACAGGPDFEAMTDHPAHPEAEAATETTRTGTLAIPGQGGAAEAMTGGADAAGESGAEGTVYTCPMHPEIVRSEPGTCPICGMALVEKAAETEQGAASEEDPHAHH